MSSKLKFSLLLIILLVIPIKSFSAQYQYENYIWGISKEKAISKVKENGYHLVPSEGQESKTSELISYMDELFGYEVKVNLMFTPISKKLAGVNIQSSQSELGVRLRPLLIEKYGIPTEYKADYYNWKENDHIFIYVNFQESTFINYYSNEYMPIFLEESKGLDQKGDKDRF